MNYDKMSNQKVFSMNREILKNGIDSAMNKFNGKEN